MRWAINPKAEKTLAAAPPDCQHKDRKQPEKPVVKRPGINLGITVKEMLISVDLPGYWFLF